MQHPIWAVYAKDEISCMHFEKQPRNFTVFQGPTKHGLGLPPRPGRTFILDSDCDQKSFLSIQQQLRLPSAEILLSAIDIPLQKRNPDNGKSDPFRIENFRGEQIRQIISVNITVTVLER